MSIQAHMEAHPEHVCVSTDISNAYNEMQWAAILKNLWERELTEEEFLEKFMQDPNNADPALKELFIYVYKNLILKSYIGLGNGTIMQDASFLAEEGVKQGNVLAVFLFCLALDRAS